MSGNFEHVITLFLTQSPAYAVYVIGITLALLRWRRHPGTSLVTVLGLGVLLFTRLFGTLVYGWLPNLQIERNWTYQELEKILLIIGIVDSLLYAAAWVLVLVAIFGWRAPPMRILVGPVPGDVAAMPDTASRTISPRS